jgi:hypothetical protein
MVLKTAETHVVHKTDAGGQKGATAVDVFGKTPVNFRKGCKRNP